MDWQRHDMVLTVGSLFAGIGGIDLGLERAGMESRWFVEWDAHCQNVLRRHWPGLPVYGDITTVDWGSVEPVDVLAGGFPCQPVSQAGRKLAQDDERWLWPEFERAICHLRPRYVLVENVAALLGRGFDEVVGDLSAIGYDAEWDCIPAAAGMQSHSASYPSAARSVMTCSYPRPRRAATFSTRTYRGSSMRMARGKQLMLSQVVSSVNGALNPNWVEWLMGFPIGHTDLRVSETP